jgi:hypothetical protein
MSNNERPTADQIVNLCEYIIGGMSFNELRQFVFDDLYSLMDNDPELFWANLNDLDMDIEDFS